MIVRASGGVVFRPGSAGPEVLLIHRPKYDDWSLPKGKDDPGEEPEEAAVREVLEETGLDTVIVGSLGEIEYTTSTGIHKIVRYFLMRPVANTGWEPDAEVDEQRWLSKSEALGVLTYDHDRELVARADLESRLLAGTIWLVRHGAAGSPVAWMGDDDDDRPITAKGERQAAGIAGALSDRKIDVILSSPAARCLQTVAPLAQATGRSPHIQPVLAEGTGERQILDLLDSLRGLHAVLCTHGDVVRSAVEMLAVRGMPHPEDAKFKKGSIWELTVDGGRFESAAYLPPVTSAQK